MKNKKYAKVLFDGTLEYAENIIRGKQGIILNPSARQYEINGFFPVDDQMPPPKKDCKWLKDGYKFDQKEKKCKAVWRATDIVIYTNCGKVVKLNWFRQLIRRIVYWAAGK